MKKKKCHSTSLMDVDDCFDPFVGRRIWIGCTMPALRAAAGGPLTESSGRGSESGWGFELGLM